jgi:CRP/FNR family transcriptional regulator, cyclic AMP receptor protein
MKERFEGGQGLGLLLEALQKQDIVRYDKSLAEALADGGEVIEFDPGADLVQQDGADNDVFFLLTGEANVLVNDRFVGARMEGTCIGEMAALDPAAPRSATVRAKSVVVALKVTEPAFRAACDAHPVVFKALAQLVSHRLRQRSAFVQPPNPQPVLFIGSSTEALPIANELQAGFKYDKFDAIIWKDGVFGPGGVAFDSLAQIAGGADFAAFIISPDDTVISREEEQLAPRDNVLFELGLFMGVLDRRRVFLIREHSADVRIPSDLLGITQVTYVLKKGGDLTTALGPVCNELRKAITTQGVR